MSPDKGYVQETELNIYPKLGIITDSKLRELERRKKRGKKS